MEYIIIDAEDVTKLEDIKKSLEQEQELSRWERDAMVTDLTDILSLATEPTIVDIHPGQSYIIMG